jgi:protein subunit release factor A
MCSHSLSLSLSISSSSQDRITDHRIGLTIPGVQRILSGQELATIIDGLQESDAEERLQNFIAQAQSSK